MPELAQGQKTQKNMKKLISMMSATLLSVSVSEGFVTAHNGSLNSSVGGGLIAIDPWDDGDASITYTVTDLGNGEFRYVYTYETDRKDVSHTIIQTCRDLGLGDIKDVSANATVTVGEFQTNNSNPGLPEPVYGIKFDFTTDSTEQTFAFTTSFAPSEGIFYAKGGSHHGKKIFAITDDGFSIATPGCCLVPEPSIALLSCLGLALTLRRRR